MKQKRMLVSQLQDDPRIDPKQVTTEQGWSQTLYAVVIVVAIAIRIGLASVSVE